MAKLIIQGITQSNGGTAKNTNIPTTPIDYTSATSNCQVMSYTNDVFENFQVGINGRFDEEGLYHGWNVYMAHDAPEQFYHVNVQKGGTSPQTNWQIDSVTPIVGGVNLLTNLVNQINRAISQAPVGGYDEIIFVSNIPEKTITDNLQDEFIKYWFRSLQYVEQQTSISIDKIFIVNTNLRQITYASYLVNSDGAKKLKDYIDFIPSMDSRINNINPHQITINAGIVINENTLEFNDVGLNIHYTWEWQKALSDYLISQIFI